MQDNFLNQLNEMLNAARKTKEEAIAKEEGIMTTINAYLSEKSGANVAKTGGIRLRKPKIVLENNKNPAVLVTNKTLDDNARGRRAYKSYGDVRDVTEVLNAYYNGCPKEKVIQDTGLPGKVVNIILDRGIKSKAVAFNNKNYMLTPEGRAALKKSLPYDGKLNIPLNESGEQIVTARHIAK